MRDTIVVTGATGQVGGELIAQLAEVGLPVRAMSRRPTDAAFPGQVEAVYGDCDDPETLTEVFHGAERAFLMSAQMPGSAAEPTHLPRLVAAARTAGVRHVVVLSVYSGGEGDDAISRWHRACEAAVTASGLDFTLLRPGRFMSNALRWAPMIRRGDAVHIPFAGWPAAAIDPADIAAVAKRALTTEDHFGAAYRLSGPQVLTAAEELGLLAYTIGRPLRLVEQSVEVAVAGMLAAGTSAEVVDAIVARMQTGRDGAEVLPTVVEVLGRAPTTFANWAACHAATFTEQESTP